MIIKEMKQPLSIISSILILIGLLWLTGCSRDKEIKVITFETTLGPIVIELFEEEAPITSKNFWNMQKVAFLMEPCSIELYLDL